MVWSLASKPETAGSDWGSGPRPTASGPDTMDIAGLYKRYGPLVYRRCAQLLRSDQEAEDAMQDVFVQLLRHADHLKADYPSSLLFRIATNVCLNRIRSRRHSQPDEQEDLLYRISVLVDLDSGMLLQKLFRRHPDSTRAMAVLHFVDGMTFDQVARELGMSASGVRRRLEKLRKSLRELEKR